MPPTSSSIRGLPIRLTSSTILPSSPSSAFAGTIPPSAVRMHFYLWQTGSRSPLVSAERAPAKTPRVNSPIFLRKRATLWLPSNSLAILNPSEIPPMPADGISPLPKDFVAPIGRLRLRRAPLVWAPLPRRKFPLISRLPLQHLRELKPCPRLLRLPSLRPKRAHRRSNLRQNPIPFRLLLRPLLLQPLPQAAGVVVVAAVAAIINAPEDRPTVRPPPGSRDPSRLRFHAPSPKILLRTLRLLRAPSIAWPNYPPLRPLCGDDPAIPVSPRVSPNWK